MTPWLGSGGGNLGALGLPADPIAYAAVVFGVVLLLGPLRRQLLAVSPRTFLALAALLSFFGSLAYVHVYLRGGPRIIDATTYYLQGAALSHGELTWEVPALAPPESFRGRFLLAPTETSLTGIFPIGYPLLLAAAFRLHAPMLLGPVLGALVTLATYRLARQLAREEQQATRELAARVAALLSVASGAVRYHAADTMSHGLSMLLATTALTEVAVILQASSATIEDAARARRSLAIASACTTYLALTRFASALPLVLMLFVLLVRKKYLRTPQALGLACLFPLAGALLQLHVQHTQTGSYFTPAQSLYYRLSDGPEGCFRYGFGQDVGCLHEHGPFVRSQLPNGYGLFEALKTTGRRLVAHGGDAANAALLLPLALLGLRRAAPKGISRWLAAYLVLHICAYAPFYFDGNYPGGGARFFSELLPLEQVLLALGVLSLPQVRRDLTTAFALPAVVMIAFAVHASFAHLALRDRDDGAPMFQPSVLATAGVTEGLILFDTDHGFNLAHADTLHSRLIVARYRGDGFDRVLYDRLGGPKTFRYLREGASHRLVPFVPPPRAETLQFQAESFWPPRATTGGYAFPQWGPYPGASGAVYTFFHDGSPIVKIPDGGTRVRFRNCNPETVCAFGPWIPVPANRHMPLQQASPRPNATIPTASDPEREHKPAESCDSIEVFFPVAGSP